VIDISCGPTIESDLAATAFGDQPARWPLPSARTPRQLWLRAVGAGGQGRYGSARDDLARLLRGAPDDALASLAHSTQASFLRQLGSHRLARGWDGRALALAGENTEAAADALIGLAADALGMGRLAASAALLSRAEPLVADAQRDRLSVRRAWVAAELAMAGRDGATAVRNAEFAVELAAATLDGSRHAAKSDAVLAAALCTAGAVDRARSLGEATLQLTGRLGLVPLRWAMACLLADIGSPARPVADLHAIRDDCARQVEHWGGHWNQR
jgi:hypothetical protein